MLMVWIVKILSRKEVNRVLLGTGMIKPILTVASTTKNKHLARECCNSILNLCYEKENVVLLLDLSGIPVLLKLLEHRDDTELLASVMGALQSVCFQPIGRAKLYELEGTGQIVPLLQFPSIKVAARAMGVVHNLSSYPQTIRTIRTRVELR